MKSLERTTVWTLAQTLVGLVTGIIVCAAKGEDNYSWLVTICAIISIVSLVIAILNIVDIAETISDINAATEMLNGNPRFNFGLTADFIKHVETILSHLAKHLDERIAFINTVGQIIKRTRLESLIIHCIDENKKLLNDSELSILQENLVLRFPEKTETMFETISDFERDNERTWSNFNRLIIRYTKLTGKYGSATDLAGGIFRYLETKGLAAGSIPIFAQKLDATLCEKKTFDKEKASEILREILRLNAPTPTPTPQ